MKVNDELVQTVAELAQLEIPANEVNEVIDRMNRTLALVEAMQAVDTDGVLPLANPLEGTQPLREDAVTETSQRDRYLQLAPAAEDGLYLVPRVVE